MAGLSPPMIEADGLVRRYGRTTALDGLSLTVSGGGVLALLGPNGAGKTSFVSACLGLTRPSAGRLRVLGERPGSRAARRQIGAMLQEAELADLLTAREQIGLFASYYPDPRRVGDVIALCGLDGFADARYGRLSGGQKRRVQFALALVGRPRLIFLDEPTTGLDAEARRGLWAIVRQAAAEGAQIVLTTHYLEEADALADRVAVMHHGRLIADAAASALRARVGGSLIRCVTMVEDKALAALPAVRSVRRSGRYAEIASADAVATLQALFALDPSVSELAVRQPGPEDAFDILTRDAETPS